ncbi:MAG: acetylornithine transaminase [Micromonosporaceae bacterium]
MSIAERWSAALMNTYGPPSLALVSGEGATVTDENGRRYLDLYGGIAVNTLGHGHPAVVRAVSRQVAALGHVSNFFAAAPVADLAERLLALAGRDGRVFFGNSGAEANEAALKLSRLTGRRHLVAAAGGFHGRTMGALALTGQPSRSAPFAPLPGNVSHVPYGDVAALAAAVNSDTAMVILEPIQGENGIVPAPPGYLAAARDITREQGALLALDEVQTGVGRTGHWYAHQADAVDPDVITLAKGLGGGLPIGACLAFGPAAALFEPGMHGSTFGGNPVCCAAALAVLEVIEADGLLEHVAQLGKRLVQGVLELRHPLVAEVRGAGLLLGVVLTEPVAAQAAGQLRELGFLVNPVRPDVLRLAPPLNLTQAQADSLLAALPGALSQVLSEHQEPGGPAAAASPAGPAPVSPAGAPATPGEATSSDTSGGVE